jgi:DNA-binding NarL/FixJ family response regulator
MTLSYNIILAEDHLVFRRTVKSKLEENSDFRIVGEAGDGLELLALLKDLTPDLIVLDITMPGLQGIEATRKIKEIYPEVKVLILTMHKDKEYLRQALAAGAKGYLPKEGADTELIPAIKEILGGRTYISPLMYRNGDRKEEGHEYRHPQKLWKSGPRN